MLGVDLSAASSTTPYSRPAPLTVVPLGGVTPSPTSTRLGRRTSTTAEYDEVIFTGPLSIVRAGAADATGSGAVIAHATRNGSHARRVISTSFRRRGRP